MSVDCEGTRVEGKVDNVGGGREGAMIFDIEKEDAASLRCCQRFGRRYSKEMAHLEGRILCLDRPLIHNVHDHTCFPASISPVAISPSFPVHQVSL